MAEAEQQPKPEPLADKKKLMFTPGLEEMRAMHASGIEARKQREAEVRRVFGRTKK